jgi:hypothetical protein
MTYMGGGDPARRSHDYYPWWLDNLAADVTGEGAFMQGAAQGAEAVRSIVTYARELYEYQGFSFRDDYGDNGFLEDYTTQVRGEATGVIVTVTRNAAGQAQHIVVNHRPRSSVLLLARLCGEKFAGTPLGKLFIAASLETDDPGTRRGGTYLGSGDPARRRTDYFPAWLDNLADDATLEAVAMEGAARGAAAVRSITVAAKALYEYQDFNYAGPYGDNGFLEDYTTQVHGEPTGVIVMVSRNAAGQTQRLVVNHRPRSSMLLVARLLGEKFAGTPQAEHFLAGEP